MNDVVAALQYLVIDDDDIGDKNERPVYYLCPAGRDGEATREAKFEFQDVLIRDARHHIPSSSVDREGFQLCSHTSMVQDFHDDRELRQVYNKEVEDILLSNVKGAKQIILLGHVRRAASVKLRNENDFDGPVLRVHNDHTDVSATARLTNALRNKVAKKEVKDLLLKKRFVIINVWRSIAGTIERSNLAFCDFNTVSQTQDLVVVKQDAKDPVKQGLRSRYNPKHKWYYYPKMNEDEVVLFKQYDSNRKSCTLHTAFDSKAKPTSYIPPRQSIETRAIVFYDENRKTAS